MKALDTGACPGPDPGFTGETTFYDFINNGILEYWVQNRKEVLTQPSIIPAFQYSKVFLPAFHHSNIPLFFIPLFHYSVLFGFTSDPEEFVS
jgi:hypothetical protein